MSEPMEIFSQYLPALLAFVAIVYAIYVHLARTKLDESIAKSKDHIKTLETRIQQLEKHEHGLKAPVTAPKKAQEDRWQTEAMELRKECARLKDDIKKQKEEIKGLEKHLAQADEKSRNQTHVLREEKATLLLQLKEMDEQLKAAHKKEALPVVSQEEHQRLKSDWEQLRAESSEWKHKVSEADKRAQQAAEKVQQAQDKANRLQAENRKWQDAVTYADGKALTPELFVTWYHRANVGRRLYQQMHMMRQLSDEKLASYQEGIEALATYVLKSKSLPLPAVREKEIAADRYLSAAWAAMGEKSESDSAGGDVVSSLADANLAPKSQVRPTH